MNIGSMEMYVDTVLGLCGYVCCLCLTKKVRRIKKKKEHYKAVVKHAGRTLSVCAVF